MENLIASAMGNNDKKKKTALVVEDDKILLEALGGFFELRGYNVTLINYLDSHGIPNSRFDLAVVDGLDGDGLKVLRSVDAERKFLYTGDCELEKVAEKAGIEAHSKSVSLKRILGRIQ